MSSKKDKKIIEQNIKELKEQVDKNDYEIKDLKKTINNQGFDIGILEIMIDDMNDEIKDLKTYISHQSKIIEKQGDAIDLIHQKLGVRRAPSIMLKAPSSKHQSANREKGFNLDDYSVEDLDDMTSQWMASHKKKR